MGQQKIALIIGLVLIIMMIPPTSAWSSSLTIEPGQTKTVSYVNDTAENDNLVLTNISAPAELLNYLFIDPGRVLAGATTTVTIQFITVPQSIRASITPDTYAVKVGESLVLYLDMGVDGSEENLTAMIENLETIVSDLQAQIDNHDDLWGGYDNQMGGLENTVDDQLALVVTAENLENMRVELWRGISNTRVEDAAARAAMRAERENQMLMMTAGIVVSLVVLGWFVTGAKRPKRKSTTQEKPKPPESIEDPSDGVPSGENEKKERDMTIDSEERKKNAEVDEYNGRSNGQRGRKH